MIYASALMTLYITSHMDMAQPQVTQALSECPVCLQKQGEINSVVRSWCKAIFHSFSCLERSFHRAVSHLYLDGHEFEWALGVGNGQGSLLAVVHSVVEWTWLSDWTELRAGKLERLVTGAKILGSIWTNTQRPIPEPVKELLAFKILANKKTAQHLIGLFGYWS